MRKVKCDKVIRTRHTVGVGKTAFSSSLASPWTHAACPAKRCFRANTHLGAISSYLSVSVFILGKCIHGSPYMANARTHSHQHRHSQKRPDRALAQERVFERGQSLAAYLSRQRNGNDCLRKRRWRRYARPLEWKRRQQSRWMGEESKSFAISRSAPAGCKQGAARGAPGGECPHLTRRNFGFLEHESPPSCSDPRPDLYTAFCCGKTVRPRWSGADAAVRWHREGIKPP